MYHSVTFGDKNSWEEWHLIPSSRPVINPPEIKTELIDIPGESGVLDLSESLTGYPLYKRRTGDIEFIVVNDYHDIVTVQQAWADVYSDIMNYLHNREMEICLEDDPEWWYEGRLHVNSWKSEEFLSRITISYDLEPYKWHEKKHEKIFNLSTSEQTYTFTKQIDHLGMAPFTPKFLVTGYSTSGVTIHFINPNLNIDTTATLKPNSKEQEVPRMVFYGDNITIKCASVSGSATLKVSYEEGSL